MSKVAIILGSTRPNRVGLQVATWVFEIARKRSNVSFELIDLEDSDLPLLDEPVPASLGKYSKEHTKKWAAKIESFDAFVERLSNAANARNICRPLQLKNLL